MYALIQTPNQGSLWRSDDAGTAWRVVSWDRTLIGRAGYYISLRVNPASADDVMVLNSSFHRSTDGGLTFPGTGGCGDCHDIWIDPGDGKRYVMTDDGGMAITTNNGANYANIRLPIGQMYHVAIDNRVPYWIYSNRQDNGTMRGPSTSPVQVTNVPSVQPCASRRARWRPWRPRRRRRARAWEQGIGGCESGFTMPDPNNPDMIWATCYGNKVTRYDARHASSAVGEPVDPYARFGADENKVPLSLDAAAGLRSVRARDGLLRLPGHLQDVNDGRAWDVISPDLSTQDPSRIVFSGGVIGDNLGQFYGAVVFAIAPSKVQRGLIWAGTNDGKIWNTRDGGKNWNDVTAKRQGDAAVGDDHENRAVGVRRRRRRTSPSITTSWTIATRTSTRPLTMAGRGRRSATACLAAPLAYTLSFAENPNRRGMLFAGTGNAFHYSLDDGKRGSAFKSGLPAAPVTWIEVQQRAHDVVLSTYGRGLYVLRDITTTRAGGSDLGDRRIPLCPAERSPRSSQWKC